MSADNESAINCMSIRAFAMILIAIIGIASQAHSLDCGPHSSRVPTLSEFTESVTKHVKWLKNYSGDLNSSAAKEDPERADFRCADLRHLPINSYDLSGANLHNVNLAGAKIPRSRLS